MPSRADVEAGRAFVRLYLKNDMSRQLVRALKAAQAKLRQFGQSAMATGRRVALAGVAMAAPFAFATKSFADFDNAMRNVSTMLDSPSQFMPNFRQGVKDMSVEFGKAKGDLAAGLYDILSATVPPEQAMQRLAAAAKLAVGGNAEVADSVSVLNTLMETYGDSFTDAADASDFLFAIIKRGRTTLPELGQNLGKILSVTEAAGMSFRDMGASTALLTRATGGTETALTALQAISATFLKPEAAGAALWAKTFGDELDTTTLKAIGMTGVLERLSKLDPGDVAKIFPNIRALRGIFPAIAKMEGFGDDLDAMANRAGNVAVAFEKMKGPLFYWNRMREQAKNVSLAIGEALAPNLKRMSEFLATSAQSAIKWIKANKGMVIAAAATVAGVVGLGVALMGLGATAHLASIGLGVLATIISVVTSPLGILVAAIAGGAAAWFAFSESGKQAWTSLRTTVMPIIETLKAAFGGIKDAILAGEWKLAGKIAMAGLKLAILQGLSKIVSAFPGTFKAIAGITGMALDGLVKMFGEAITLLQGQWNAWGKHVLNTVVAVAGAVMGTWQKAVAGMANWMLETSAKGGVMGKAMSKVLGVDMGEEQSKAELAEREGRKARLPVFEKTEQVLEQRIAAGGDTQSQAANVKALDLIRAQIADIKAGGSGTADSAPVDVLADARSDIKRITEQWEADTKAGLANAAGAADAFIQNLPDGLATDFEGALEGFVQSLESGQGVEAAAKELAALRSQAAERKTEAEIAATPGAETTPDGAPAVGGGASVVSAAPSGVALTATYSAAAARIAGYQAGGPEKKMAAGIDRIAENTAKLLAANEQFLAGWKVA